MKKDTIIQIKSYAFAVRIVKVYQFLSDEKKNKYLTTEQSESLLIDVTELLKIIGSIQKTLRIS
jgi:hypothetical protein